MHTSNQNVNRRCCPFETAVLGALAATLLAVSPASAAAPNVVHVEGYLHTTGGGPVADGGYKMTFALFSTKASATPLWSEGPVAVTVKGGQWTWALGSTKAIDAAKVAGAKELWMGLKVGTDPELPRSRMWSSFYALSAGTAAGISCTGCVSASAIKADAPLNLVGQTVKAKAFEGDGSKLTGIKIPSGACADGKLVAGIDKDGKLICKSASPLPDDGVAKISQGLLQVVGDLYSGTVPVKIPDNNPVGGTAKVSIGNVGAVNKLTVTIDISVNKGTSGIEKLKVCLIAPGGAKHSPTDKVFCGGPKRYLLHNLKGTGKKLTGTWPDPNKELLGDIKSDWAGKNPQGTWQLVAVDVDYNGNLPDIATINKFVISARTSGNKKINNTGDLVVDGQLTVKGGITTGGGSGSLALSGGLKLGAVTKTTTCDATRKGELRWQDGDGLVVCDGVSWSPAVSRPAMFQGGCDNSNPGGDTWRYRCINRVSINTRPDIYQLDGNSGSYSGNGENEHSRGRLYVRKEGYYSVNVNNYGHGRYYCMELRVSGTTVRHTCGGIWSNWSRTFHMDAVVFMKKDDFLNVRIHCSHGCSNAWHRTTYTKHLSYSGHNWLRVIYLGPTKL